VEHSVSADLTTTNNTYSYGFATALNDTGGVAGYYEKGFNFPTFTGNVTWQLNNGVYPVLYWDGYDNGAEAYAINNSDISVGVSGNTDPKHVQQASVFGPDPKERRHPLLGLNATCSFHQVSSANGINDAALIVGYDQICNGYARLEPSASVCSGTLNRFFHQHCL